MKLYVLVGKARIYCSIQFEGIRPSGLAAMVLGSIVDFNFETLLCKNYLIDLLQNLTGGSFQVKDLFY